VSVGGVVESFTLDAKGKARTTRRRRRRWRWATSVTIPVEVVMNGTTYAKAQPLRHGAKQGKSGRTK
jgi:hypothetical protein